MKLLGVLGCEETASESCSKYEGGTCRAACRAEERLVPAKCRRGGAGCQCCARSCSPRESCVAMGGFCVDKNHDCKDGVLDHDGCDGYKCACCKPISK